MISVWAECGWKLQFTKGRISAVTSPKNANVLFRRGPDGQVTDLSEGATALLKVQSDFEGRINGFSLADGKKFGISTIERPVIQYVAGLNVISATQPSLGKVTLPDGTTWNYGYASDANFLPPLSITKPGQSARKITWDPATKLIRSDGHWNYDIQPALISGANAAIGRTERTTGQREFWHYDTTKGEEFQIGATGVKTVKRWFTSGVLNGKLRVISENGTIRQKCSYDDKGRLVSNHVIGSSTEHFEYGETGRLVRKIENDKTYMYDSQGRLLKVSDKQREIVRCSYDSETGLLNGVWSLGKRIF